MLEIAQHVQMFLHKNDRPPISLHQEMLIRQKNVEVEERKRREEEVEALLIKERAEVVESRS